MRKKTFYMALSAAFIVILALGISSCAKRNAWMPAWLSPTHAVAWKENAPPPTGALPAALSKKEALEDIAAFKYLVETSYSGYEYQREFNHTTFSSISAGLRRAFSSIRETPSRTSDLPLSSRNASGEPATDTS